jgi:hypothetical protein
MAKGDYLIEYKQLALTAVEILPGHLRAYSIYLLLWPKRPPFNSFFKGPVRGGRKPSPLKLSRAFGTPRRSKRSLAHQKATAIGLLIDSGMSLLSPLQESRKTVSIETDDGLPHNRLGPRYWPEEHRHLASRDAPSIARHDDCGTHDGPVFLFSYPRKIIRTAVPFNAWEPIRGGHKPDSLY